MTSRIILSVFYLCCFCQELKNCFLFCYVVFMFISGSFSVLFLVGLLSSQLYTILHFCLCFLSKPQNFLWSVLNFLFLDFRPLCQVVKMTLKSEALLLRVCHHCGVVYKFYKFNSSVIQIVNEIIEWTWVVPVSSQLGQEIA